MNNNLIKIILAGVLAISTLCSCTNGWSPPSEGSKPQNKNTGVFKTESKQKPDLNNLQNGEYRITELPGKITVSDTYNVYSTDNDFTEEMCMEQGIDYNQAMQYVELLKEYSGIDMIIVPKNSQLVNNDFQITVKVKEDDTWGIENLSALNNAEFEAAKSSLLTAFETVFSTIMTSDVYIGKNLKWIILEGTLVKYEIRYATILNGKMLYFCIENTNGPLTDAQKQEVNQIIDTLQY